MADPPTYEESISNFSQPDAKGDSKLPPNFSIREEVVTSRSQHVAAVVNKLLPHIRERARAGLSKSTLLLFPSDSINNTTGELAGFSSDELPTIVQLEGRQDKLQFWRQTEALELLQSQVLSAISGDLPASSPPEAAALPVRETPPTRGSFFGRKQSKTRTPPSSVPPLAKPLAPVGVEAKLDEVYFRQENEYGLVSTKGVTAVELLVDVS